MPHEFSRTDRVAAQLQRDLAVLVRDEIQDPRLGLVTIQAVRVTRDLSQAKVYVTFIGGDLDKDRNLKVLTGAARFLRTRLARQSKLRTVPELLFVYDESIDRGTRLTALIERAVENDVTKL